jgi:hypothetical protein
MSTIGNPETSHGLINQEAHQTSEPGVDWEKRYKDLQSFADKTRVGLESENIRLRKATTVFTPPKTAEDLALFRNENPDWMGVIETVAHDIASNSIAHLQEDVNKAKQNAAASEIVAAHPDAMAILSSPEFDQWANNQGPEIRVWLQDEFDSSKVIRVINYYKAMSSHAPVAPTQYNEPSAAQAVRTHGSVVTPQTEAQPVRFTREQINRMHPDVYEANYDAIKAQAQSGGFN